MNIKDIKKKIPFPGNKEGSNNPQKFAVLSESGGLALLSRYRRPIMGFSALWILFFHYWTCMAQPETRTAQTEQFIKTIGFCGVDIFLMLSGIGLNYSIKKKSIPGFYYNRIKRVFLPFLIIGIYRCVTEKWPMEMFWKNVLSINFYSTYMYSFLWFVTAIMTLYLAFPLYHLIFKRNPRTVTMIALMLWLFLAVYFRDTMRNDLYGFTNRIPIFVIGVYLGWAAQNKEVKFTCTTWLALGVTLITGLYFAYLSNFQGYSFIVPVSNCCIPNLLIAVSLPFLMAKLFDLLMKVKYVKYVQLAVIKFLSFYGLFSLELYCVQDLVAAKVFEKLAPDCSPLFKNAVMLAAATVAGFVLCLIAKYFWKLIDFLASKVKKLCSA